MHELTFLSERGGKCFLGNKSGCFGETLSDFRVFWAIIWSFTNLRQVVCLLQNKWFATMHNADIFPSHFGWVLASCSGWDEDSWHFCLVNGQIQFRVKSACEVTLYKAPTWPLTHTNTHMDINTHMWQSISYTGTQANTHVKWLVAETSEHILHSASKSRKGSFDLPL